MCSAGHRQKAINVNPARSRIRLAYFAAAVLVLTATAATIVYFLHRDRHMTTTGIVTTVGPISFCSAWEPPDSGDCYLASAQILRGLQVGACVTVQVESIDSGNPPVRPHLRALSWRPARGC